MTKINTVKGPVAAANLGMTLMHEHIFLLSPEIMQNYDTGWGDEETRIAEAAERLSALKSQGVDTLVDLTVIGLGRYIPRIQRVAALTEVNIVVATGIYAFNDVPMFFDYRGPGTFLGGPEIMIDMFVKDIEKGIGDTGVKAAILKCATDKAGMTRGVKRILRATAEAHCRTGVPITTHTHAMTKRGLEQQALFKEQGVDLGRVVIGHSGDTTDLGYLEELIANGSYLGMDRFGIEPQCSFEDRISTVAMLCAKGYADRMVLSHDAACFLDAMPELDMRARLPNWHYRHICNDVIPALRTRGISEKQITQMMVENPKKIFAAR